MKKKAFFSVVCCMCLRLNKAEILHMAMKILLVDALWEWINLNQAQSLTFESQSLRAPCSKSESSPSQPGRQTYRPPRNSTALPSSERLDCCLSVIRHLNLNSKTQVPEGSNIFLQTKKLTNNPTTLKAKQDWKHRLQQHRMWQHRKQNHSFNDNYSEAGT